MPRGTVRAEEIARLEASGAFDSEWYRRTYPDVGLSGLEPAEHFLWIGYKLGRSPLPPPTAIVPIADPPPKLTAITSEVQRPPLPPLDLDLEKANHFDITDQRFWSIVPDLYGRAGLGVAELFNLYSTLCYVRDAPIQGAIVECGIEGDGGIMLVTKRLEGVDADRRLFAIDSLTGSFKSSGTVKVQSRGAKYRGAAKAGATNVPKGKSAARKSAKPASGLTQKMHLVEAIPAIDVDSIAILRLNTETHQATKLALEQLYGRVVRGGVVVIGDYGYAPGTKWAVDDFIRRRNVLLQRPHSNVRSWIKAFG